MSLFSRSHICWVLRNLQTFEEGRTPLASSSYTELPGRRKGGSWASFEGPAGLAAVITERLERCGQDGVLVYLCYCFDRDWRIVARMMGLNYYDLKKRINLVLDYISGEEPRPYPYRHYIMTRKVADRLDK